MVIQGIEKYSLYLFKKKVLPATTNLNVFIAILSTMGWISVNLEESEVSVFKIKYLKSVACI